MKNNEYEKHKCRDIINPIPLNLCHLCNLCTIRTSDEGVMVKAQGMDRRLNAWGHGMVAWIARHWLALFNLAVAMYVGLAFLAPVLAAQGLELPARVLYTIYSFFCHQLPDHSYFLFGERTVYSLPALEARGLPEGLGLFQRRTFIGNPLVGYKVALCQRDVAIYGSFLLGGLAYGLVRGRLPRLSLWAYVLFLIPIGLDGLTQLVGLRESTWLLRTVTGALFALGSVWLVYPFLDQAMQEVLASIRSPSAARSGKDAPLAPGEA